MNKFKFQLKGTNNKARTGFIEIIFRSGSVLEIVSVTKIKNKLQTKQNIP